MQVRSLAMAVLSPLLFYAPDIHLRNIEEVWIDRMVMQVHWKNFIGKLVREWEGLVLYVSPANTCSSALTFSLLVVNCPLERKRRIFGDTRRDRTE